MIKLSHTTMVVLSGLVWLAVGCMLLSLGLNFLVDSILRENLIALRRPLLDSVASLIGGHEQALLALITLSLWIGFIKARYIFSKTVQKSVDRILTLPNPAPLSRIYTMKYYILLGTMVLLGFLVRYTTLDIRGTIDVIIGSALIHGAVLYFRKAFAIRGGSQA